VNGVWSRSALAQGIAAGVVALIVLAVRAAIDGRPGPSFADLWTALGVGVAVAAVALLVPRLIEWQVRRAIRSSGGRWEGMGVAADFEGGRTPAGYAPQPGGINRFDRFTDRARKVLTLSQDEAQRFNHNYIGTEHLLLGLVRVEDGIASRVLAAMNVDLAKVRTAVEFIIGRGDIPVVGEVGLTPRAKRVIELAIDEARGLEHHYIGTEHLLLGLIREGEGIAAGVLQSLGVEFDRTRQEVLRTIAASSSGEDGG